MSECVPFFWQWMAISVNQLQCVNTRFPDSLYLQKQSRWRFEGLVFL
ncbi:hypothetical protein [Flavobacterium tructae]|nr:hypothetical protein [Flavobacterium tructae]